MSRAVILINSDRGLEKNLMDQLRQIQNVKEVYLTYGVYDLIAIVEAKTQEKLREVITRTIRTLPGLKTTFTMIVVE